ncbi:DUF1996 domain-containing protein [Qipengyuania sphaerica]|uniref:DUF1996 domain-containing protein n=1 Tax=Qipengyuania sphaerica TaxID=2867243 RepID=UPI001C877737|nr:DUF1996 domain-containing protein [Qipengyuania sphaerica]
MQLPKVASGLNIDSWLYSSPIPETAAPDVLGAFRFLCAPSHLSYDDPIVHPGKSGAAHLHQFFGNTEADANSTYESLRMTGDSTCTNALNRSAYWMPALLDGQGSAIIPNYVAIYYKRRPSSDTWFASNKTTPTGIPRGLKYVFGHPNGSVKFKCVQEWTPVRESDSMPDALSGCGAGQKLMVSIASPSCWDGRNLDSADHRSHVSMEVRDGTRTYCPASHPYALAQFTMTVEWSIETGDMPALWRFSSDMDNVEPGSTFHSDWFGAWEDAVLDMWQDGCIDNLLNCSDGDLGTGRKMKRNNLYPTSGANPRKIAVHTVH